MPVDFSSRATLTEWMDEPCSYEDFKACLRDLAQVNRMTLAYRPTLAWLQGVLRPGGPVTHIVDVGCGGGDMLRRIEQWALENGVTVRLTGVDLNPYAARAAREATPSHSAITWLTGDALSLPADYPIDLVISSLFTHHLADGEIINFLRWMEDVTRRGWFINDLHREVLPYHGFRLLATVMRWHRFVRHDGPVSIRRAFRHDDWQRYLVAANIVPASVDMRPYRPARLCLARWKP